MDIHDLRFYQAKFENERQELKNYFKKLEKLRKEFVQKFSLDKLVALTIEKYVVGHQDKDSFCYWLETRLMDLGKIKGGSTAEKKFGIYFGKTKNNPEKKYRFLSRFGHTTEEAYNNIRDEILSLISAGENNNLGAVNKNKLSPMFKGKILSTYFPDKYLSIFSSDHLDHFIEALGLDLGFAGIDFKEPEKRRVLVDFKGSDAVMKHWAIYEFSRFLYRSFGTPWNPTHIQEELRDFVLPPLDNIKAEFIELSLAKIKNHAQGIPSVHKPYKPDYDKENKINRELGMRGENLVFAKEKELLESGKLKELSNKVNHMSLRDDSLGYDIESYESNGTKKYIEVKSTNHNPSSFNFVMTSREIQSAKELDNYYVYIVFNAGSEKPKILKIKNPLGFPETYIKLFPIRYRVQINPK